MYIVQALDWLAEYFLRPCMDKACIAVMFMAKVHDSLFCISQAYCVPGCMVRIAIDAKSVGEEWLRSCRSEPEDCLNLHERGM